MGLQQIIHTVLKAATTPCKSMFEKWLNTQKDASWNQLIEVIRIIKLYSLARQLEKGLIGKVYINDTLS